MKMKNRPVYYMNTLLAYISERLFYNLIQHSHTKTLNTSRNHRSRPCIGVPSCKYRPMDVPCSNLPLVSCTVVEEATWTTYPLNRHSWPAPCFHMTPLCFISFFYYIEQNNKLDLGAPSGNIYTGSPTLNFWVTEFFPNVIQVVTHTQGAQLWISESLNFFPTSGT